MEKHSVAIVIPAYNEEETIAAVINKVSPQGDAIVVNDCSSDNTASLAESAGAVVVNHETNRGYDGALDSGFKKASELGYRYVITFDADGQHEASKLAEYKQQLEDHDLVLGVRPDFARISERLFAWFTRISYGVADPLCGLKGYSIEIYNRLGWFDSYDSIGSELAIFAVRKKYSWVQIDIPIHQRQGASRFGRVLSANWRIFKAMLKTVYFNHVSRRYQRK